MVKYEKVTLTNMTEDPFNKYEEEKMWKMAQVCLKRYKNINKSIYVVLLTNFRRNNAKWYNIGM